LANSGGRCRWKIENEGFNLQKNSGFNLEHAYGIGQWQIKNYYVLMQIAHMILCWFSLNWRVCRRAEATPTIG
jgi:hypothetical protein